MSKVASYEIDDRGFISIRGKDSPPGHVHVQIDTVDDLVI
jgi:hypothetical protein